MKFKRAAILLSLICLVFFLKGQSVRPNIKLGPSIDGSYITFKEYLDSDQESVYTVSPSGRSDAMLRKYNRKDYREQYAVLIEKKLKSRYSTYMGAVAHHGRVSVFFEDFEKKAGVKKLLVKTIDKRGSVSEPEVVSQFTSEKGKGGFYYRFSVDKEKMVVYKIYPSRGEENEILGLAVYDKDFKLLWERDFELGYPSNEFYLMEFTVSSAGHVFAIGKHKYEKISRIKFKERLSLHKFNEDGHTELKLDLEGHDLRQPSLTVDAYTDKAYFYCWLSQDEVDEQLGMAIFSINQDSFEYVNRIVQNFDPELKGKVTPEERAEGKPRILADFQFRTIVTKPTGEGIYLLAEKEYTKVVSMTSGASSVDQYTYFLNDIMVISLNSSDEINFISFIPKNQITDRGIDNFPKVSFRYLVDQTDNLHLFFNDNPKNQEYKEGAESTQAMEEPDKSVLVHYTLGVSGEGRHRIMQRNSLNDMPEFRRSENLSGQEVFIVVDKGKDKLSFGTLTLR